MIFDLPPIQQLAEIRIAQRPVRRSDPGFMDFGNNIRMGMRAAGCRNYTEADYESTAKILSVVARGYKGATRVLYLGNERLGYTTGIVEQARNGLLRGEQVILVYCTSNDYRGLRGPNVIQSLKNIGITYNNVSYLNNDVEILRLRFTW